MTRRDLFFRVLGAVVGARLAPKPSTSATKWIAQNFGHWQAMPVTFTMDYGDSVELVQRMARVWVPAVKGRFIEPVDYP